MLAFADDIVTILRMGRSCWNQQRQDSRVYRQLYDKSGRIWSVESGKGIHVLPTELNNSNRLDAVGVIILLRNRKERKS